VLLAAWSIFGEVNEWIAAPEHVGRYTPSLLLGATASLFLLGAAIAILLQKRQAARLALVASVLCFVAARLLFPWMGILVQLVGFVLPVGLLIALYWPRKPSALGAA
jgi:hypothetical protein